jgi:hypothetical protein
MLDILLILLVGHTSNFIRGINKHKNDCKMSNLKIYSYIFVGTETGKTRA